MRIDDKYYIVCTFYDNENNTSCLPTVLVFFYDAVGRVAVARGRIRMAAA